MQELKLQKFGANNQRLSNISNPLKATCYPDKEVFFEIGHHYGFNKKYLEICTSHYNSATTGKMLFFETIQEAKDWLEQNYNLKVVEVA